ncbi:MAG: dihydroorotase [Hydrogenophaga sp.]|uniref:dihydroorotase n=1 Tax=Hydrogenophaga sp. TaxID=1904254 RepID=UPI0016A415EC|nr:dihydroorotase [Hydrogenophaga sp.]NIM43179.1 dihydroorotase [Hydrogenophaga sp.]NIN28247.1 dihydroorotase [Hydrogenophaga sp.]NIN30685.1 dihydroorotase [Hydrogenophaga sp.]NIN57382.1 dihydroorotase [Hydrogenophaga sp.]NIO51601.1 dihydroorotase [Hydrogenophaga sp.]
MKILIQNGRVIDPASGRDEMADVAIAAGRIIAIGPIATDFHPARTLDATGCIVAPGLVDLSVRLKEPGQEHAGMLESETAAAVAGGVTSLVCPPDTEPVLDEPGLVDMLKFRAEKLHRSRVFPLGALTRGLGGEVLTEMAELTEAGCVGFGQAEVTIQNTQVLLRALQYAATFGYTVWLRPQDLWLGKGVAASGPLATRLGLAGVPAAAETIALHTLFELMRGIQGGARVHLCRLSSAAGVALVRAAKAEGLPVTCDVSVHNLHLTDVDIGFYDSRFRLQPPLRQQRDRDALRAGLADGTIDALVSDHNPVDSDAKTLPFAEAEPGASAVELLLGLACTWAQQEGLGLMQALSVLTHGPQQVLGTSLGTLQASVGQLAVGGAADVLVFHPDAPWVVAPSALRSQGRHTPFEGHEMPVSVRATLVAGQIAHTAEGVAALA